MRSLSGVQSSGKLHIGNYFGAIRQFIRLQDTTQGFYFVANLHALTTQTDPAVAEDNTREVVLSFLSLGLDPAKATLFRQSDVPQVTELSWYLSCQTSFGLLQRCHAYKDKVGQGIIPTHALFAYPVLMASDIIIFDSDIVPVGEDQRQHIEVARDIAIKFNQVYGEVLRVPESYILDDSATVPGVDGRKMSKSYGNAIDIFAPEKELKKIVMSIVTDSRSVEEPKDPDTNNVFNIYKLMASKKDVEAMRGRFLAGGLGYGDAKKLLLGRILDYFGEARRRREALEKDSAYVDKVLADGANRAREVAGSTIARVRKAMGVPSML
ncbi:MAG: tryptophan--tRNA ligase [Candidatus Brocadiia bacterium]